MRCVAAVRQVTEIPPEKSGKDILSLIAIFVLVITMGELEYDDSFLKTEGTYSRMPKPSRQPEELNAEAKKRLAKARATSDSEYVEL